MVIAPKNHFKQHPFVDREGHIQTFKENVYNIGQKEFSVLVYHGVAGIGKTSLRKKFPEYLEKHNLEYRYRKTIWASIDLRLEKHREKNTFLVTLKNDLQKKYKNKMHFPAFEIAHAIYWKKANPEIPLRKENYLFFEGDDAFDDFFGVIDKIPYFSIVPATARILKNLPDYFRKWWTKTGEPELKQLSEKEPLEIEEMLPYFWAQDLNNYLEHASKSAVLFIDTYEALWENHRSDGHSRDEWIREELIPLLPRKVLWVICGKEVLKWEDINCEWNEYLTQYRVEELLGEYCTEYLENRGIIDKEIQETIFKGSKGVPYYLELSADTYELIEKNSRKPKPEDFGENYQKITDRFFRFLSPEEKNALNVLSVPHFWDYDLFEYLVKEFNTGYPTNDYEELCSFSFIAKAENNRYQMHQLMQESLQKTQKQIKPDSVKRIHKAVHEYYSSKLENIDIKAITPEHEIALTEAFYHAKEALEAGDLLKWFISVSDPFNRAAFWQLITPMYEEMLQILDAELGPEHPYVAATLNSLAGLYERMGEYEKALPCYQRALDIREEILDPQHPGVADSLNSLAGLYESMGEYKKALSLYQRALGIREKTLDPQHLDIAVTLNNLSLLYHHMGNYEKALPLNQRALDICEKVLGPQHPDIAATLNNLAELYRHMGEYEKTLPLYQRALDICEKVLGPQHPHFATTLNNIASLYKDMGEYEKALPFYQRVLEIREEVLGPQHPDVARILNNLALVYNYMGEYEKALPFYQRALEIREEVLGPQHPDVAVTLTSLASLYTEMEEYEKALSLNQRALDICEKVLGPQHPLTATTLNNLAGLYYYMGDYEKVFPLCQRALDIREKVLGPQHPDVATILDILAILHLQMGEYEKALPFYQRYLEISEKVLGLQHPDVAATLNNLAGLYEGVGEYEKALPCYRRALKIVEKKLGQNHPTTKAIKKNYNNSLRNKRRKRRK